MTFSIFSKSPTAASSRCHGVCSRRQLNGTTASSPTQRIRICISGIVAVASTSSAKPPVVHFIRSRVAGQASSCSNKHEGLAACDSEIALRISSAAPGKIFSCPNATTPTPSPSP